MVSYSSNLLIRFLLSQYFTDALKITIGILFPAIIFYRLGIMEVGITLSLGALCVSITDTAGPYNHRRNAMLICIASLFVIGAITVIINPYLLVLCVFLGSCCFFFSMLHVYGNRAASLGIAVLLVLILGLDQTGSISQKLQYAYLISLGGTWYFLLSAVTNLLIPYQPAKQLLGECMVETGKYIQLKSKFYNLEVNDRVLYESILEQQTHLADLQQQTRELLFKTREIVNESTPTGRKLLLSFIDLVDLYEQSTATDQKYEVIREKFNDGYLLSLFEQVIAQLGEELIHLGTGIITNQKTIKPQHGFLPKLNVLKRRLDEEEQQGKSVLVLKRVLINLRNIVNRLDRIYSYQHTLAPGLPEARAAELKKFVPSPNLSLSLFKLNLTPSSNYFRHAMRVALVCMAAFLFVHLIYLKPYSYWILLTIIVILKPGFSLTQKRNTERVAGTILGGIIGFGILKWFPGAEWRFLFLVVFMVLAFSFLRIKYVVSVLFMTPYVLLVFSFITPESGNALITERIIDTLIGATAAYIGVRLIYPSWESYQIKNIMAHALVAHLNYLVAVTNKSGNQLSGYRLARKELYIQSASLSGAFQRMLTEPKSKQIQGMVVYRFVVLTNQLSSYLATLSNQIKPNQSLTADEQRKIRSVYYKLMETIKLFPLINDAINEIHFSDYGKEKQIPDDFLQLVHQTVNDLHKEAITLNNNINGS